MVPIFVIAGIAIGMAAFVLLIQTAVRNGIRMSGLIDWRTQYELERIDDVDGGKPTLHELMRSRPRPIPRQMPSSGM